MEQNPQLVMIVLGKLITCPLHFVFLVVLCCSSQTVSVCPVFPDSAVGIRIWSAGTKSSSWMLPTFLSMSSRLAYLKVTFCLREARLINVQGPSYIFGFHWFLPKNFWVLQKLWFHFYQLSSQFWTTQVSENTHYMLENPVHYIRWLFMLIIN